MASCLVVLVMAALGASSGSPSDVGVGGVAGPSGLFNVRPLSVFTGHCNASIARGAAVWKPAPGVVDVFFPKVKAPRCANPAACSLINSSLHANVIVQPGDSLRLTFDLDFSSTPTPTPGADNDDAAPTARAADAATPAATPGEANATLVLRRYPRDAKPANKTLPNTTANVVTLFKVSGEAAFESCDVGGGQRVGQVKPGHGAESHTGVVTIAPGLLSIDDNYFLGRSVRWGGECLKMKVSVKTARCGERDQCSGNGVCYATSSMASFQCACCEAANVNEFCGPSNLCAHNPCQNGAACVRVPQSRDDAFRCLCLPGYAGRLCEEQYDACDAMVCRNGATCVIAHDARAHCSCPPGYVGLHCEEELTGCDSSPCVHGICVDQAHGYRCFCQPGFGGAECNFEYNECESGPCLNGATCLDRVAEFQCVCPSGYAGPRCETQVNLCEPNPCGVNQRCVDHGTNVSCECIPGLDPALCAEINSACQPSPCLRGGTCWASGGTFFCACKPGLTGDRCQEPVVSSRADRHDPIRGAVGHYGLASGELDLKTPLPLHLDHTHSVYVAIGTLVSAVVVVVITVTACYCRSSESSKWSPSARLPFLWRDHRASSPPSKEDQGMDVPLAVAMESETFQQRKFESLHPTRCQVYWSEARRDAAVLD